MAELFLFYFFAEFTQGEDKGTRVVGLSRSRELPGVHCSGQINAVVRARCEEFEPEELLGEEPEYGVDPDKPDGPAIKLTDGEGARARLGGVTLWGERSWIARASCGSNSTKTSGDILVSGSQHFAPATG